MSWGDGYAAALPRAARRAGGVFYTPPALVSAVVEETLAPLLPGARWHPDGSPALRVLDPAAGDGRFLVACADHLADAAAARGHPRDAARAAIVRRCLVGIERDPAAAGLARAALGPAADVRVGEALAGGLVLDGAWDAVVGNPPYVRSVALRRTDPELWRLLRGALAATSFREWDLYAAFVEKALAWAAPGGEVGLVVPSRWFTAAFAAPLRARLAAARAVRKIVDYGAEQVFPGATTYVALVFLTRRAGGAAAVDVARAATDGWHRGALPPGDLGGGPWALAVGAPAGLVERLRRAGPPLGAIARIAKGAGTNADPVFLLEPRGGRLWSPALGEWVDVEDEAAVPCVRGRDVEPFGLATARRALLPYDGDRLLTPDELARRWPGAHAYLERCRPLLEARERGRFAGARAHAWGRPQNLRWLRDPAPKVVVPDAARRGRAALDRAGTLVIDTAYAVRPHDAGVPAGLLLAVLGSPVVAAYLRVLGIPLRGGYFRMKTAYLAGLPVPDPASPAARRVAGLAEEARPGDAAADDALARAVAALYGVTVDELGA